MNTTHIGLFVGLILGVVAVFGGFVPLLVVVLFGGVGLLVGLVMEGRLDLSALTGRSSDRR